MSLTRRQLLLSGASTIVAGGAVAWSLRSRGARATSADLLSPELPPCEPERACTIVFAGDVGQPGPVRDGVLAGMREHARRVAPTLRLLLGDNFYPRGVDTADDPRWHDEIEVAFGALDGEAGERERAPLYAILGNHDHKGVPQAQTERQRVSSLWRMPGANWSIERALGDGTSLALFALDTTPMDLRDRTAEAQLRWLEHGLARSGARWKIVVGHHPILSYGAHGPSQRLGELLDPLFARTGVHAYLAGHEHDQQLVHAHAGWKQVISGAGSAPRPAARGRGSAFASSQPGFACLSAGPSGLWVEFLECPSGARTCFQLGGA